MYKFILCVFLAACSGCAKDHAKPPATLSFISVGRESGSLLYDIRYESDIDVLDLFGRGERVGMVSGTLNCALADDVDFSVGKAIQFSAVGLVDSDKGRGESAGFSYLTNAFLVETSSNRSSQRQLSAAELNQLLSGKQQIPCKVVVTAYGYKPYYSNTMNLPVADLLREVNKP
ncbi:MULTISPECIES: hypothetical protein [Pseudomonas]|uniref:hypothetical protein n=1 Tax=Pseudomonas TaxID=286 RepID=UPI001F337641|nr:hypothetical protein [Pseudomonas sputi]